MLRVEELKRGVEWEENFGGENKKREKKGKRGKYTIPNFSLYIHSSDPGEERKKAIISINPSINRKFEKIL